MRYRLFLLDLDDTLLDFRASERLSFKRMLASLGVPDTAEAVFADYQGINRGLWTALEKGEISKDVLKVERFRRLFALHGIDADPRRASDSYLDWLPQTVVLIDGARALCDALAAQGEIGIITNGIEQVQSRRIAVSGLADRISFVATSEACGHAKPDERFFAFSTAMARRFVKSQTVIIGDRLEADVLGANRYGIDSCWFNPARLPNDGSATPTLEVHALRDIPSRFAAC